MAFKMKGNPLSRLATTKSHGTNANYKKSGAPGLLGKILDPAGIFRKKGGKGGPCPPKQSQFGPQGPQGQPTEPAGGAAATAPAPAAAAPAVPEEVPAPTQMRKKSPLKDRKKWYDINDSVHVNPKITANAHNDKHLRDPYKPTYVDANHNVVQNKEYKKGKERDKKANPKK